MLLDSRNVLITGATGDIGGTICEVFLRNGASLFLTGTNNTSLDNLKQHLLSKFKNAKIEYSSCDLSNIDDIPELVRQAREKIGDIDILICNAGVVSDALAVRMSNEQWQKVIDVNLTANFVLARECVKMMIKKQFGRIINISSVVGMTGNIGQANYSASKAGLIAMTKCFAIEYASKGITANCVAPGFIDTNMTKKLSNDKKEEFLLKIPIGYFGKPEDVANACLFLASNMADYITGETISVNGGMLMK